MKSSVGKQKTKSGAKKRIKVRKSGSIAVEKSCRRHLLTNKSKSQKKLHSDGMPVSDCFLGQVRKMMPGTVRGKKRQKLIPVEE